MRDMGVSATTKRPLFYNVRPAPTLDLVLIRGLIAASDGEIFQT